MLTLSENKNIFTRAGWVWLLYLLLQLLIDTALYFGQPMGPLRLYYLINFFPALIFLGLSFAAWRGDSRARLWS